MPHSNAHKKIDIVDIVDLKKRGLSPGAAAKVLGCSKYNVQKRYKKIETEVAELGNFKELRADILAIKQKRIINAIDKNCIQKASLRDKVISFGVLYDKERLERGKGLEEKGIKIEIINFAGASSTGQGIATKVTFVPQEEVVDVEFKGSDI